MRHGNPWDWDKFTWAWVAWIGWFVFWETWAIVELSKGGEDETFSNHIWFLRDSGPSIVLFVIIMLTLWMIYHFVFEGRR